MLHTNGSSRNNKPLAGCRIEDLAESRRPLDPSCLKPNTPIPFLHPSAPSDDCLFVCLEEFTLCCVQGSLASSGQVRAELPITGQSPEVCLGSLVMLLVGELRDVFKELHSLSSIFFMQTVLQLCGWWRIKRG